MEISLPPELEKYVESQVAIGRFRSAEDMISAGLLRLKEEGIDALPTCDPRREELEARLIKSIDQIECGEGIEMGEALVALKRRIKASR